MLTIGYHESIQHYSPLFCKSIPLSDRLVYKVFDNDLTKDCKAVDRALITQSPNYRLQLLFCKSNCCFYLDKPLTMFVNVMTIPCQAIYKGSTSIDKPCFKVYKEVSRAVYR